MEIGRKKENGPRPEIGKMAHNGEKMGFGVIFLVPILGQFRAMGHFLFFGPVFPIFSFRPIFHSIPGGLTPKPLPLEHYREFLEAFVAQKGLAPGGTQREHRAVRDCCR